MSDNERNTDKLTLEELLRLKKAERPDEMFWSRFDRDLEKKIVRSVISRELRIFSFLRWLKSHAVVAVSCVAFVIVIAGAMLRPGSPHDAETPTNAGAEAQPSGPAAAELAVVDPVAARPRVDAPTMAGSRSDFVIEVLSSGGTMPSSANLTLSGKEQAEQGGAYYVADQLSSADQGWSGERLPF